MKSHSGANIAKVIQSKLFDWNIDGKLCSIVLDNAFLNNLSDILLPRGYLLLNGKLFRFRCCCHMLNLIVQVGLGPLSQTITKIRESVRHVRSSHAGLEHFRKAVEQANAPKKKLILDVSTRCNSTYKMLAVAYEFHGAFDRLSYFYEDYKGPPSSEEWENMKIAKDCLQLFDDVTNKFSGTRYPTANLYFNDICLVHYTLKKWLHSIYPFVQAMATCMLEKFNKCWSTLSLVLSFGCILNPRYKMKSIEFYFEKIYNGDFGNEVATRIHHIKDFNCTMCMWIKWQKELIHLVILMLQVEMEAIL
ncbi:hypothetical protein Taro_047203 [Colocasia esculenta]|uniref:hAT-like transposase RNase-H fold domain-containing protein n=1 Tax=Colocasia esculenta TaxID=4460 RepID=A0A843WVL1_COLES|nr:hypothetical protein [Colocasia esculenta]